VFWTELKEILPVHQFKGTVHPKMNLFFHETQKQMLNRMIWFWISYYEI